MSSSPFSLFVDRKSWDWTDFKRFNETYNEGRIEECPAECNDGENSCIHDLAFISEGVCFADRGGHWVFRQREDLAEDGSKLHDQCLYDADDCSGEPVDCLGTKIDVCSSSTGRQFFELKDWCIQSDIPNGDFNTPLVLVRLLDTSNNIGEGSVPCTEARTVERFYPSEYGTCQAIRVVVGTDSKLGSSYRYCCPGGEYITEYFVDDVCNKTTDADGTELTIPGFTSPKEICDTMEEGSSSNYVVNCQNPSIYCKSMAKQDLLPFFTEQRTGSPGSGASGSLSFSWLPLALVFLMKIATH